MIKRIDAAEIIRHFRMPIDEVLLVDVVGAVVGHVSDFVPKFPTCDIGGISPSRNNVSEQVFRDSFGFPVREKFAGRCQPKLGVERVVAPVTRLRVVQLRFVVVDGKVAVGENAEHQRYVVSGCITDDMVEFSGILLVDARIEIQFGFAVLSLGEFRPIKRQVLVA